MTNAQKLSLHREAIQFTNPKKPKLSYKAVVLTHGTYEVLKLAQEFLSSELMRGECIEDIDITRCIASAETTHERSLMGNAISDVSKITGAKKAKRCAIESDSDDVTDDNDDEPDFPNLENGPQKVQPFETEMVLFPVLSKIFL